MLLGIQVSDCLKELFGCQGGDLFVGERGLPDEFRTVEDVFLECAEACPLAQLAVRAVFEYVRLQSGEYHSVRLRVEDQILHDVHGLADILVKSAHAYVRLGRAAGKSLRAGKFVHLFLDLLGGSGCGAEVAQVIERQIKARIALDSAVEHACQGRDVVGLVLLVEKSDAVFWISVRKSLCLSRLVSIGVMAGAAIFSMSLSSPMRL